MLCRRGGLCSLVCCGDVEVSVILSVLEMGRNLCCGDVEASVILSVLEMWRNLFFCLLCRRGGICSLVCSRDVEAFVILIVAET
jgi:hypothetical protein